MSFSKLVIFTLIVSTRAAGTVPPNFTREIYLKTSSQSLSPRERYNWYHREEWMKETASQSLTQRGQFDLTFQLWSADRNILIVNLNWSFPYLNIRLLSLRSTTWVALSVKLSMAWSWREYRDDKKHSWQLSLKYIRVLVILTASRYTPSFNTAGYWHCPGDWLNVIISAILSCFRHDSLIYSVWDTVYSLNEPSDIQLNGFWRLDGRRKETLEREYIILLVSKR